MTCHTHRRSFICICIVMWKTLRGWKQTTVQFYLAAMKHLLLFYLCLPFPLPSSVLEWNHFNTRHCEMVQMEERGREKKRTDLVGMGRWIQ